MAIPSPSTIEEEERHFYAAIGETLVQWQLVEAALAEIFCWSMGAGPFAAANMAFHTIQSFDSKLGMTHSALVSLLASTPYLAEWNALRNKASRRNDRRNHIAHFSMAIDLSRRPGYRYHLKPNFFDFRAAHKWGDHPPTINRCQLVAIGRSFATLSTQFRDFARKVASMRLAQTILSLSAPEHRPPAPRTSEDRSGTKPEAPPSPSRE
jgi:hypothetical protein